MVWVYVTFGQRLLSEVYTCNPLSVVHLLIKFLFGALLGVNASELSWTPHLVCVELVWTSKFVTVGLCIDTFIERVARFKAKFFVPSKLLVVAHGKQFHV